MSVCYTTVAGDSILKDRFSLKIKKPWKVVKTMLISEKVYVVVEHKFPELRSSNVDDDVEFRILKDQENLDSDFCYINSHFLSVGSDQSHEFHTEVYHILLKNHS